MRHLLDVVIGFEPTLGDTFATALPNANFSQQTTFLENAREYVTIILSCTCVFTICTSIQCVN
jgi:hypothetical protein